MEATYSKNQGKQGTTSTGKDLKEIEVPELEADIARLEAEGYKRPWSLEEVATLKKYYKPGVARIFKVLSKHWEKMFPPGRSAVAIRHKVSYLELDDHYE